MIAKIKSTYATAMRYQLRLNYGSIKLDVALTLESAQHFGKWGCSKAGQCLVNDILNDYAKRFKRFHHAKNYSRLNMVLANLLHAYNRREPLIYSRDRNSDKLVITLIDYLAEIGLIDSVIQPANMSGCCSYAIPLPELGYKFKAAKARIAVQKDHQPLIVRDSSGKDKSLHRLKNYTPRLYQRLIEPVQLYNSWWNENSVTLDKKIVLPFLHRVFNHNTELGGRFYGRHQQSSSSDRQRLLFNGKPTIELDYRSLHIAILYAWAGVEMLGDPYTINGFDRHVVKSIMLRLVNSENISALERVITASSKPQRKRQYSEYKQSRQRFELRIAKGLKAAKPRKPKWLDWHIENIPTGFKAKAFINALNERHSAISHLLGGKDIGLRLQAADGALMAALLMDLYNRKKPIPVLPVHDSLICRKTNLELVKLTMKHHFKTMFNASISIK